MTTETQPITVRDIDQLRELVAAGSHDFAIALAGGLAISRKTIRLGSKAGVGQVWVVENHIDGSRQKLTDDELWTKSNIGEALDKHSLGCLDPTFKASIEATFKTKFIESSYPTLPEGEEQLTDWYAGAVLKTTERVVDAIADWEPGDASVAFSDIGINEADNRLHGQLVIYASDFDGGQLVGVSAEIDPSDAWAIVKALNRFIKRAKLAEAELPGEEDFVAGRLAVTRDTPCTTCGETMDDEFTEHGFDGVMNNAMQPFHHGCEDF